MPVDAAPATAPLARPGNTLARDDHAGTRVGCERGWEAGRYQSHPGLHPTVPPRPRWHLRRRPQGRQVRGTCAGVSPSFLGALGVCVTVCGNSQGSLPPCACAPGARSREGTCRCRRAQDRQVHKARSRSLGCARAVKSPCRRVPAACPPRAQTARVCAAGPSSRGRSTSRRGPGSL